MQPPTVREVIRKLRAEGWELDRTRGDHRQYRKGGKVVTIAGKPSEHLDRGTWAAVRRTVGW